MGAKFTTLDLGMSLFSHNLTHFLFNVEYGKKIVCDIKQIINYQNDGNYDEALQIAHELLEIMQLCEGVTSCYIQIILLHFISDCYLHNNYPEIAVNMLNEALDICNTSTNLYGFCVIKYQCAQRVHLHRKHICDIIAENANIYAQYEEYKNYSLESKRAAKEIHKTTQYQYIQQNIKSVFSDFKEQYTEDETDCTIICYDDQIVRVQAFSLKRF